MMSKPPGGRFGTGARAAAGLFLMALLVFGCRAKKGEDSSAAAPSASAQASGKAGPCAELSSKVCEKAGAESPSCGSFKDATALMSDATCQAGLKDLPHTYKKLQSLRSDCDKLVKSLCDAVGQDTQSCALVRQQTPQFAPERCHAMLEHVSEIVADLKKMEVANQPLAAELRAAIAKGPAPGFGSEQARVTVVEFSDFQCPFCSRASGVVHQIREKYGDRVRFVFRQFPLGMHPHAREAAEASLVAHAQGKFWEFHDQMFKNQGALDRASLEGYAKAAGLDVSGFTKALDDHKAAAQVDDDLKLGESVGVQGTPTLFVNGTRVDNAGDPEAVLGMIETALREEPPG